MKPETITLILAALAFVIYFGPAALRMALRPERGSVTDLRLARFEALLADFDKRARVGEKLDKRLAEDKARASSDVTTTTLASIVVDVVASKADEPPSVTTTVSVSTDPAAASASTEKDPRP